MLDVDRLAGQAREDRRHGRDEVDQLLRATRAWRTRCDDRLLTPMSSEAEQAADER